MNGDTHIYDGNLYLTGNVHKGTFSSSSGTEHLVQVQDQKY